MARCGVGSDSDALPRRGRAFGLPQLDKDSL